MRAQIRLGRIFGVEIGLHYSWFIIALLITLSLAGHFRSRNPDWGGSLSWALAWLRLVTKQWARRSPSRVLAALSASTP